MVDEPCVEKGWVLFLLFFSLLEMLQRRLRERSLVNHILYLSVRIVQCCSRRISLQTEQVSSFCVMFGRVENCSRDNTIRL